MTLFGKRFGGVENFTKVPSFNKFEHSHRGAKQRLKAAKNRRKAVLGEGLVALPSRKYLNITVH